MESKALKPQADNRIVFVVALRKIVGYAMFLSLIFYCWTYRDQLTMVNFNRIMSYFDTDLTQVTKGFKDYKFEIGIDSTHRGYSGGLAIVNRDTFKLVNAAGREDLTYQLKYSNPTLSIGNKQILVYDRGETSYSIFSNYALLKSGEASDKIVWAKTNQNGDYMMSLDQSGYRSTIEIFSANARSLYKWSSSEYYILMGALNERASEFAVYCIGSAADSATSLVRICSTRSEEPLAEIDLGQRSLYSIEYDKNQSLVLVCDDGVYYYNSKGQQTHHYPYAKGQLLAYEQKPSELLMVALQEPGGQGTKIAQLDGNGVELYTFSVTGIIRSVTSGYNAIAALTGDKIYYYDCAVKELTVRSVYGAKSISIRPGGSTLVIYNDKAEVVSNKEG